jgi:hypothetical protein
MQPTGNRWLRAIGEIVTSAIGIVVVSGVVPLAQSCRRRD